MRRMVGLCFIVAALAVAWAGSTIGAQGIPVTNDLILSTCTGCHQNNRGMVSRISYLRKSPEAVRDADRIAVLANGRVSHIGTHVELVGQRGAYRSFLRVCGDEADGTGEGCRA